MKDSSHEGLPAMEPELKEEVLAKEAERLDKTLTEALMKLPQYRLAKKKAKEKDDPIIRFEFNGWSCEDSFYSNTDGQITTRDLTIQKMIDGKIVVEDYVIDRLTVEKGAVVEEGQGIETVIMFVSSDGTDEGAVVDTKTQTAVDRFDKLIDVINASPRLHAVPVPEE